MNCEWPHEMPWCVFLFSLCFDIIMYLNISFILCWCIHPCLIWFFYNQFILMPFVVCLIKKSLSISFTFNEKNNIPSAFYVDTRSSFISLIILWNIEKYYLLMSFNRDLWMNENFKCFFSMFDYNNHNFCCWNENRCGIQ